MQVLTRLLKGALNRVGLDLVRHAPTLERPFELVPVMLRDYVRSGHPVFVVQVGANDGRAFDPLGASIVEHRLPGLLIEPLPDLFEALRQNYAGLPGLIFENVAIGADEGRKPFFRVRPGHDGPEFWQGLGSFDRGHLERAGVPPSDIESCMVDVVPMGALLDRHRITDITLLQVDTEGFDDHVVRATLETGVLPRVINYEHCHLPVRRRSALKELLVAKGYRFLESWSDTTAARDSDRFPGLY
ncbi:MAG: FkbM family methyltransferase [Gemmatimonadales bacterium]|nr:MAG: FkbM family methyltransferase [Gemmatimonadales bacterium]